jgi:hypothetical protein
MIYLFNIYYQKDTEKTLNDCAMKKKWFWIFFIKYKQFKINWFEITTSFACF